MATVNPSYHSLQKHQPWSPGWLVRLPWLGLGALIGSILSICAAIGVLVASNGQPISSWPVQPTVWLSVASTAANILLGYALAEGVTISWWRRAMRPGQQLHHLHLNWKLGNSLLAALTAGRAVNIIAIASIMTAIAPITNPLLQRASRVTQGLVEVSSPVSLSVRIAPALPDKYYTGYASGREQVAGLFSANFTPVVQQYNAQKATVLARDSGCRGICKVRLPGMGLSVNCSSYTAPFRVENPGNVYTSSGTFNATAAGNGTDVFQSYLQWGNDPDGKLQLDVQYKDQSPCEGNLIVKNCTLRSALVLYPTQLNADNTVVLDPTSTIFDDVIQDNLIIAIDPADYIPSPLAGYFLALKNRFDSTAHISPGVEGEVLSTTGSTATQYAVTNNTSGTRTNLCNLTFTDPTMGILASARELMFLTALSIAASDPTNSTLLQTAQGVQTSAPAVYESNYLYLILAVTIATAAVIAVSLTFQGYSVLGRDVSLSPLEVARALGAPMLVGSSLDPNSDVKTLVATIGSVSARYGAVCAGADENPGGSRGEAQHRQTDAASYERKAAPANVSTELDCESDARYMRLEIADEAMVQMPHKGWKFAG